MEKLSEDLLYFIFLHTLPSDFSWREPGPCPSIRTVAPFNFSLVCRSWRALVLSRPILWASITIEDNPTWAYTGRANGFCPTIEAWLRLSGTSPLTFRLRIGEPGTQQLGDLPIHLLPIFFQECHRWKDVDIDIHSNVLYKFKNPLELPISSHLSFLSLQFDSFNQVIVNVNISPLAASASSNLQVLHLGWGTLAPAALLRKDALHLPSLRELTFQIESDSDLDDALSILSASPRLQKLRLIDAPARLTSERIVSLPNLTDFTLVSRAPSTTRRLLDLLVFPALKTIDLSIANPTFLWGRNKPTLHRLTLGIVRFFSRTRPQLVALGLRCLTPNEVLPEQAVDHEKALKELFSLVSGTLERLTCDGSVIDNTLIKVLSHRSAGDHDAHRREASNINSNPTLLCPSLREITLSCHGTLMPSYVSKDSQKCAFEEMIVSRWKGGAGALRKVNFYLPGFERFAEESARLKDCVKDGLVARFDPYCARR